MHLPYLSFFRHYPKPTIVFVQALPSMKGWFCEECMDKKVIFQISTRISFEISSSPLYHVVLKYLPQKYII